MVPSDRFLAVGVNAPKGRVSPHQQPFIDRFTQACWLAVVAQWRNYNRTCMITSDPIENLMRETLTEQRDSNVPLEWWPIVLAGS